MLLNSFSDLDGCHLSFLESFYKNGAKTWCIGPSLLYNDETNGTHNKSPFSSNYLDWLNQRISKPTSVIYISFGTQAYLSDADLNEVGLGLKMSGHEFLWVVKSQTWSPPDELEERLKGTGLIVRDWVDQQRILAHNAVGGFLSHCGWNSVMQSLSMGVPLLVLPMNAEQPLNAKQAICDGVRELMSGEEGKKVREKAEDLGRAAQQAVKEGGSSYKSLTEMIDILQARQTGVSN
ncbi:hypothetical protein L1049_022459 [Liquidambar formosana]|uniref:UDP-glycosyltransferases domain-containing protein n=1 Tax=Liquidambar formosana TaxID=63359 RepID=A0AAP0WR51_LIQFO